MRNALVIVAVVAAAGLSAPAKAGVLLYDLTCPCNTLGTSFLVNQNLTPDFSNSAIFLLNDRQIIFEGNPVIATITWGSSSLGIAIGPAFFQYLSDAPLFTGTRANPTLLTGEFNVSGDYIGKLRVTEVEAAVPEPATWAMMLIGFLGIGGAMRYRWRHQTQVRFAF